jgi:5-methylcytosine-specific restriction protein B
VNYCRIEKDAATYKVCRETDEVVWVGAPINRAAGNKVVKATKSPRYEVGDEFREADIREQGQRLAEHGVDPDDEGAVERWFEALEGYIAWRELVGGRAGDGIAPATAQGIRSSVRAWIRHSIGAGLDPSVPATDILKGFLAGKDISDKSRRWRAGHVQRWWRRWPQYQESIGAEVVGTSRAENRLAILVAEFRLDGYPSDEDLEHEEMRQQHERTLTSIAGISFEDRDELKRVWANTSRNYGSSGNQQVLNKAFSDAVEAAWPQMRDSLEQLCFGDGAFENRIDAAIRDVRGLGPLVATRLPAICHPERFIPIYVLRSSSRFPGKLDMIEILDELGLLDETGSREAQEILRAYSVEGQTGAVVMRSNDLLLESLRPHFTDDDGIDVWGISRFLYWLSRSYWDETSAEPWLSDAEFADLSDKVLCDVGFLRDVVALLEDKGQVILYGPPGTGKTYLAQSLAEKLALYEGSEDDGAYSLVQFHPAYSYEDFFEGFRPQVDDDGQMTYELTPGPLVRLAERAADHADELHVMVIDEINRANLPRVLGELLYLLEYRDEWAQTQYRPVEGFTLPSNLWIIGTMNTADRSIALIDAAMRRRFHFVPFFPDREPTAGLLRRWYERNELEQDWVADLLDAVNERLHGDLGADYMLIGPSHFMRSDLDENNLRRIWEYNIEPLIEDQFFGRQEVIDEYRFSRVWSRYGPGASIPDAETGVPGGPVGDAGSQTVDGDDADGEVHE